MLRGVEVGGSGGFAIETPWTDLLNISGSADFYPSNGIGPIFRRADGPDKPYALNNLTGNFLALSATGAANFQGASLCLGHG